MNAADLTTQLDLTRTVLADLAQRSAAEAEARPIGDSGHDYALGVANAYREALATLDHFLPPAAVAEALAVRLGQERL